MTGFNVQESREHRRHTKREKNEYRFKHSRQLGIRHKNKLDLLYDIAVYNVNKIKIDTNEVKLYYDIV